MKIARNRTLSCIGSGILVFAALTLFSMQASATAIPLNSAGLQQVGNAGDGTIQAWLIQSIIDYNTAHGTSLPTSPVGAHPTVKVDDGQNAPNGFPSFGADTLSITLPGDLNGYLVLHWGGKEGGVLQAFDLTPGGTNNFDGPSKNGLSFYSFYGTSTTATPEPGTMLLCATGIAGLAGSIRRKLMV